jgi:hypothetical protein
MQPIVNFSILGNIWIKLSNKVKVIDIFVNSNVFKFLKQLFLSIEEILIPKVCTKFFSSKFSELFNWIKFVNDIEWFRRLSKQKLFNREKLSQIKSNISCRLWQKLYSRLNSTKFVLFLTAFKSSISKFERKRSNIMFKIWNQLLYWVIIRIKTNVFEAYFESKLLLSHFS